jgi:hypothetical protein
MQPVIRADGSTFQPPEHSGRGRKPKWPWRYLEVGDHFVAPADALASLRAIAAYGSMFGREHRVQRGIEVATLRITRMT